MKAESLFDILGADFYTGVPDSQLQALCNFLMDKYGISEHHVIAANEGNCTAIAAGHYLATGKVPVVYMQNSGIGNMINPAASLLNDKVYAIPCIFVVGWRGEPGIHDEPQHIYQGEVTLKLLEDMDIRTFVIGKETTDEELAAQMEQFRPLLDAGKSVAFVVRKGALEYGKKVVYSNEFSMKREEVLEHIVAVTKDDPIVSTTGKASRELFEIRERNKEGHACDFLTVGSMGHSSSIALGIAMSRKNEKIWCVDGDGACFMHMGAMAVAASRKPDNMIHIVLNNAAHETVGGMPTVAGTVDLVTVARGCGYPYAVSVNNFEDLDKELKEAKNAQGLRFIEVKCALGSRADLGRPTTTAIENKEKFMERLR